MNIDYVNDHLANHASFKTVVGSRYKDLAPRMELADGTKLSVQASNYHYCTPREYDGPYTAVEVGYPTRAIPEIIEFAEEGADSTGTVYAWVPVDVLNAVIAAAGGVK